MVWTRGGRREKEKQAEHRLSSPSNHNRETWVEIVSRIVNLLTPLLSSSFFLSLSRLQRSPPLPFSPPYVPPRVSGCLLLSGSEPSSSLPETYSNPHQFSQLSRQFLPCPSPSRNDPFADPTVGCAGVSSPPRTPNSPGRKSPPASLPHPSKPSPLAPTPKPSTPRHPALPKLRSTREMMPSDDDASFCTRKVVLPIVSPSPLLLLEPPGLQHLLTGANAQPDTAPSNSASSWWAEATGAWQHAFPCDLCGIVFARESGLAQHKVRHLHLFALNSAVGCHPRREMNPCSTLISCFGFSAQP